MKPAYFATVIILLLYACNGTDHVTEPEQETSPVKSIPPIINYVIVNTYPHDTAYFTEGLEFYGDQLLESSGGNNNESPYPSAAGLANLKTGKIDQRILLDKSLYFGEGITVFGDKLYMLTWKSKVGFIFDARNFKKIGQFAIPSTEGWGLTHDSSSLIMSDGSNSLHFLDPQTLRLKNIIGVTDNNGPVSNINELEYVDGYIYANQWTTPYILKIEAATGLVVGRLDLSTLVNEIETKYADTWGLNGIAYNRKTGNFFIVGKRWPLYYELKLQ